MFAVKERHVFLYENVVFVEWRDFFESYIWIWLNWLKFYLASFHGDIHIHFYENAKANLRQELVELNGFLGLEMNFNRLDCTVHSNSQKLFKRSVSAILQNSGFHC